MNPEQDPEAKQNRGLALLFLGVSVLIVGVVYYYDYRQGQRERAALGRAALSAQEKNELVDQAAKRRQLEKSVNTHIQMTNRKIEIDKEKIHQEARFTIPQVGQLLLQPEGKRVDPIDMRGDRNEMNAARDLRRGQFESRSAGDLIHQEMAENQARDRQNEQYMKEYARQFVENARANGYEVELSSDYRVLNVRKINPAAGSDIGVGSGPAFR